LGTAGLMFFTCPKHNWVVINAIAKMEMLFILKSLMVE